jgi:uncharacterized protein with HEPN domain
MKHNDVYLRHILDEVLFLLKATQDLEYDSFIENRNVYENFFKKF